MPDGVAPVILGVTTVIAPSLLKWSLRRGVSDNGVTTEVGS
jgi:hypothetical protein